MVNMIYLFVHLYFIRGRHPIWSLDTKNPCFDKADDIETFIWAPIFLEENDYGYNLDLLMVSH